MSNPVQTQFNLSLSSNLMFFQICIWLSFVEHKRLNGAVPVYFNYNESFLKEKHHKSQPYKLLLQVFWSHTTLLCEEQTNIKLLFTYNLPVLINSELLTNSNRIIHSVSRDQESDDSYPNHLDWLCELDWSETIHWKDSIQMNSSFTDHYISHDHF